MPTDLHPDVVRAIWQFSRTRLGRKYDRYTRRNYDLPGWKVQAKTVAGEFGGRSTKTGRNVVSSAGARGPAQFIASTRADFQARHGIDPWRSDREAIKGMALHHLERGGIKGYNPGMPTYQGYILGQRLNKSDRQALRDGANPNERPARRDADGRLVLPGRMRTEVGLESHTIPGQSFEAERQAARRELLLGGDINLERLLAYKGQVKSLQDVPARTVTGDISVNRMQGQNVNVKTRGQRPATQGRSRGAIHEVFYDPLNRYWDSGGVHSGGIGDHSDHVHVSADKAEAERLGKLAQGMGLRVSGQDKFGGRPSSGHTEGSFHYKGMGIDVSGDPAKMRKFARIAMREARRGRGK